MPTPSTIPHAAWAKTANSSFWSALGQGRDLTVVCIKTHTHTHARTLLRFDLHSPYCTSYSLPLCLCVQRSVAASLAPPAGRVSHHRAYVWGNGVAAWQSRRQPSHQRPAFSARLPCNSRDLPHQRGGAIARQKCSESFSLSSSASSWSFCLCCCCLCYCRCFPGARSKRAPEPTRRLNSQNRREIRVHAEGRKAFRSSVKESNHWCFSIALFFSLVVFFFFFIVKDWFLNPACCRTVSCIRPLTVPSVLRNVSVLHVTLHERKRPESVNMSGSEEV